VAAFGPGDVERLLADASIVRHRAKIEAAIANARATLRLHEEGGTLAALLAAHAPEPRPRPRTLADVPSRTAGTQALCKDLRRRGFAFVGPTTLYAAMQACGFVDDHLEGCATASGVPGR
jgi:DNA-3-methyladenine glycosylase I